MTNSTILTKTLCQKLLREEHLMLNCEKSWAGQILKLADYKKKHFDTLDYFRYLKNKKLQNHKKVARFALDIFRECGAWYRLLLNRKKFLIKNS